MPLPYYDHPPLAETVLGIFFQAPPNFSGVHHVLFWRQFRDLYPLAEERPALDEIRESFDDGEVTTPQIRWQFFDQPPPTRLFAQSQEGRHILQIQQDAIHANWRWDRGSDEKYVHFDQRLNDFAQKLQQLEAYFLENNIGQLIPTSCVITYVNHFALPDRTPVGEIVDRSLCIRINETWDHGLPAVENADLRFSYRFPNNSGRLHVSITPLLRDKGKEKERILQMTLTGRSAPIVNKKDVTAWFGMAHEQLVKGFTSLTQPHMHEEWTRVQ